MKVALLTPRSILQLSHPTPGRGAQNERHFAPSGCWQQFAVSSIFAAALTAKRSSRLRPRQFAQAPGIWHEYSVKDHWYSEYDSVEEFGPVTCSVEGELPTELKGGVFFRNGPGNFSRGGQRYNHIIDGDGMILQICFGSDTVAQGRFIRTATFIEEEQKERICSRSSFGTQREGFWAWQNVLDSKIKNCANTHVVAWGRKLLALFETGLPLRLDPKSLATLGVETFDGSLTEGTAASVGVDAIDSMLGFGDAVTAHPHIDAAQDRFLIWSNRNLAMEGKTAFHVTEWDKKWECQSSTSFEMDAGIAPHDFAATPSFYIWAENRMGLGTPDLAKYLLGLAGPAEGVEADPHAPLRIHLIARGAPEGEAQHLVVETPPWFCIHHSHAEECQADDGSTLITLYSAGWDGEGLSRNGGRFLAAWKGYAPDFDVIPPTHYWRTKIRVAGGSAEVMEHGIFPGMEATCMDHPHVHPAEEGGSGASFVYMTYSNSDGLATPSKGWLRLDLKTGEQQVWATPPCGGCFCLEPVVVPKKDQKGAWVLGILNDHEKNKSCLCVLDGDNFSKGPVCRVWTPCRLPHALHGSFCSSSEEFV